jgi:hypothetical protein
VTEEGTFVMIHTVRMGVRFVDPGAVAMDDVDGDLTANIFVTGISLIDTSRPTPPGDPWVITYRVSDASGNAAEEVRRRVHVVCAVNERICQELVVRTGNVPRGQDIFQVSLSCSIRGICDASGGELFAQYMLSGDLTVEELVVPTTGSGSGIGSRAGAEENEESAESRLPPVISLVGPPIVTIKLNRQYLPCDQSSSRSPGRDCERGAVAVDAKQGTISALVEACADYSSADSTGAEVVPFALSGLYRCSHINTATPGSYVIPFSVTNDAGLRAVVNRTLVVLPNCAEEEGVCPADYSCSVSGVCPFPEVRFLHMMPANTYFLYSVSSAMSFVKLSPPSPEPLNLS